MDFLRKLWKIKPTRVVTIVVVLIIITGMFLAPYISEYYSTTSTSGEERIFLVKQGMSVSQIADRLEREGYIKSKYTFIIKHRMNDDKYSNVYAGEHKLNTGMCLTDIMDELFLNPPALAKTKSITIPEGYSIEMIASLCQKKNLCTYEDFIQAVESDDYNYEFIKYIPQNNYKYKLEGFLFPSTYEFGEKVTAHDIVDKLLSTFEAEYTSNFQSYDNMYKNMIIASLVEREAALDSERCRISGVIHNRLNMPMILQIDATVVYAKSNGKYDMTTVTYDDLAVDSPYNLYKYEGLTPGPICSPGIKSILAAANPESHGYYYYHTDEVKKDGSHIFTATYDEHVATMN